MAEININWDQIQSWEGFRTKLYVPECTAKSVANPKNSDCFGKAVGSPIRASGVTIGSGIDLGQQNIYDLKSKGIPKSIIEKVKPFLGQKRTDAQKALAANPEISLSNDEVNAMDLAFKRANGRELAAHFKKQSNDKNKDFSNIPPQAQTVLASVYWQNKKNMFKGDFAAFWENALAGDYTNAAANLEKSKISTERRKKEAAYLRNIVPEKK